MFRRILVKFGIREFFSPGLQKGASVLLFLALVGGVSIYSQNHLPFSPSNSPEDQFSAVRAMDYLREVAKQPHPIGSAEHARVGEYIKNKLSDMELSPETQKAFSLYSVDNYLSIASTVENIMARLEGMGNSKAVMLVAHYDSVPTAPGAADDGSGVAILLETLRALKSGPPLKNDVIFLFTDSEENWQLGARAFVKDHPWAKDVGIVLNFEARGVAGPSLMFETSDQNGWLIREFAKAAPNPVANSFLYDVYKTLPNDTDLTVFKQAGIPGFNFAFVQGAVRYHTAMDRVENVNKGSLQHQGSYAVALAKWFGNLNLRDERQPDVIYFDLMALTLIKYPMSWVMPLTALVTILLIAVFAASRSNKHLSFGSVTFGFLTFAGCLIATALVIMAVWWLVKTVNNEYHWTKIDTYNSTLYLVAFSALTIAVVSLIVGLVRRIGLPALWMGALFFWLALMVLSSFFLPGGSFLFAWPLLFSLIAFANLFTSKEKQIGSAKNLIITAILTIPGVIIFSPLIVAVFYGLTVQAAAIVMIFFVLLLGLAMMPLTLMAQRNRWALPASMALVSLTFLILGSLTAKFDRNHPRPDHLFYLLDQDSGQAVWASLDESPSEWTSQVLDNQGNRTVLDKLFLSTPMTFLVNPGVAISLPPPEVVLLEDSRDHNVRNLRIKVSSPRRAPIVSIYVLPGASVQNYSIGGEFIKASINGKTATPPRAWQLNYLGLPVNGIELTLQLDALRDVEIRVADQSYGLPQFSDKKGSQRPDDVMPSPFYLSDTTIISKSFKFR